MLRLSDGRATSRDLRRAGLGVCNAGWLLWVISLFLPAAKFLENGHFPGWFCAWCTLSMPLSGHLTPETTAHWLSLAAGNALMLISPLWLRRVTRGRKKTTGACILLMLAFADTVSVLFPLGGASDLMIGYGVWMTSFGLTAIGSLYLMESQRKKQMVPHILPVVKLGTADEQAAKRELYNYLHSS